jgi:serine phosphatase RsbU (regulator of sigma subunit)
VHLSRGRVGDLPVHPCLPLGLGPADQSSRHRWLPGDRLLLFTDGLIEARDEDGRFLPRDRIEQAVRQPTLEDSLDALEEAVHNHAGQFGDDLALLLLARTPSRAAAEKVPSGSELDSVVG